MAGGVPNSTVCAAVQERELGRGFGRDVPLELEGASEVLHGSIERHCPECLATSQLAKAPLLLSSHGVAREKSM